LIKFFAPWCGHCKQFAPEYDAAAEELSATKQKVAFTRVDATVSETLAKAFKIQAYPTIVSLRDGGAIQPPRFDGRLDKVSVLDYVKLRLSSGWQVLDTEEELADFLHGPTDVKVVFQGHSNETDIDADEFKKAAEAIGPDKEWLRMALTPVGEPGVWLHREPTEYDDGKMQFVPPSQEWDKLLMLWMLHHRMPFMAEMTDQRFNRWLGRGHLGIVVRRRGAPIDDEVEIMRDVAHRAYAHIPIGTCAPFWIGVLDMDAEDPIATDIREQLDKLGRNNPVEFAMVSRGEEQGDYPAAVMDEPFETKALESHIMKYCKGEFSRAKKKADEKAAAAEKVLKQFPVIYFIWPYVFPGIMCIIGLMFICLWYRCCARPFYLRLVCGRRTDAKDE